MPARGLCETVYCALKARTGQWPADFLAHVERSYRGKIPPRFLALVARLERERPWERELEEPTGLPPTITIVGLDGRELARFRPTREEWESAAC